MYIAFGAEANLDKGTTCLHQDVADAVNFITWTYNPAVPSAIWHIFPRHTVAAVRKFLNATRADLDGQDPIQSQTVYLTDGELEQLAIRYKVAPWTIYQRPGDMVFIPAGCPHQV